MGQTPSRAATPGVTARDRAVLSLKNQRDRLKQYQLKVCCTRVRAHGHGHAQAQAHATSARVLMTACARSSVLGRACVRACTANAHGGDQIQTVLDRETQMARELAAAGDRQRALLCMRRKRYQEDMLRQTEQQLINLEQMVRARVRARAECASRRAGVHRSNLPCSAGSA